MSIQVNNIKYESGRAALRANAELLANNPNCTIQVEDEAISNGCIQLNNGRYMCTWYNYDNIERFFNQVGLEFIKDETIIPENDITVNNTVNTENKTKPTNISRHIPSNVSQAIDNEAETSEFVGKTNYGTLNRYDKHHLIPYFKRSFFVDCDIHNKDNLIALNKTNHDILHHGTHDDIIFLLVDIIKTYPAKGRFIKDQGLTISDLAELSLSTHK
jgi:hypothetical protein